MNHTEREWAFSVYADIRGLALILEGVAQTLAAVAGDVGLREKMEPRAADAAVKARQLADDAQEAYDALTDRSIGDDILDAWNQL